MTDILVFGAHPDDIEFACGGILAKAASQGQTIALCDLTLGEKGSNGTPEERKQEAESAARLIGAERIHLNFGDCEVFDSFDARQELAGVIRHFQPKLVIAPPWQGEQHHPDHTACGQIARHACRYARFGKEKPHTVQGILHYLGWASEEADFVVDITDHFETYKQMIECHKSQLKTRPYFEWCETVAKRWGMQIGTAYAQPLIKGNPIAIDNLMHVAEGTKEL